MLNKAFTGCGGSIRRCTLLFEKAYKSPFPKCDDHRISVHHRFSEGEIFYFRE